jgi:hypothetical protein
MFRRLQTAAAVLVLAAAAVAVPILVIEAGSSTTTGDGRTLNASFEHRDAATGDNLTIWLYASEQTYTQRYQDTGGGGGGSGRAQGSSRAGGSSRPHDGGSQTYTSRYLDVFIDRYDAGWNPVSYSYGGVSPASLVISGDLSSGSVTGVLTVETWDPAGNYLGSETVDVDLDFTATGPLRTTRESYRSHVRSPRERSNYMTTTSRRAADAGGAIMFGGDNVAAGGSWYAEIATFASRSSYTWP